MDSGVSVTLARTRTAMAVLPADACLFRPVDFHVDRTAAFLAGFLDFLRILGERLSLLVIGHVHALDIVVDIHSPDSSWGKLQFNFLPTNGYEMQSETAT